MDVILERCAGLDVHQGTVTACIRYPGPAGERTQVIQTFGTSTPDLLILRGNSGDTIRNSQLPSP